MKVTERTHTRLILVVALTLLVLVISACYKDAGDSVPPTVKLSDVPSEPLLSPTPLSPAITPTDAESVAALPTAETDAGAAETPTEVALPATKPALNPTNTPGRTLVPTTTPSGEDATTIPAVPINSATPAPPSPTVDPASIIVTPGLDDIPPTSTAAPTRSSALEPTPTSFLEAELDECMYVVQPGDTLLGIARDYTDEEFELTVDSLVAANPTVLIYGEETMLQVGWELELPIPGCEDEETVPTAAPLDDGTGAEGGPDPMQGLEGVEGGEGGEAPVAVDGQVTHVVQPGDTVFRIAQRYGVTIDAIVQANGLQRVGDNVIIHAGQVLVIPPAQ